MRIFAFAASTRAGSFNQSLLAAATALVPDDVELDIEPDFRNLILAPYDDAKSDAGQLPDGAQAILERVQAADAIIISSPEYNWSMPGTLKNTIDWLSRMQMQVFKDKAILLLCASPSVRGGVVGLTQLRVPLEVLGAWVYPQLIAVGDAHTCLRHGHTEIENEKTQAFLEQCVTDFISKANALSKAT